MTSSNNTIISKFGGSSMADAEAITRSAAIASQRGSSVIVVSATFGTTNILVGISDTAETGIWDDVRPMVEKIRASHETICDDLSVTDTCRKSLRELLDITESLAKDLCHIEEDAPHIKDQLFGMGERLSSLLITDRLNQSGRKAACIDAGKVIRTDNHFGRATPQFDHIEALCAEHLQPLMDDGTVIVTQGFIGSTSGGEATTLGRGGSDYSAAILAWGLNAGTLEIWTDVSGMATTDPRIVPQARPIPEISFQEAAELATFGAKILHPSTLIPAIWKEIPVFVGNSTDPDSGGTWIYRDVGEAPLVRALAIRKKQTLLTITTPQMLHTYGFLNRIFKVCNDHRISVDSITTSEISVAMTVDDYTLQNKAFITSLEQLGRLSIEPGHELISLIGNNINHTAGLARRLFTALADINVRMICQGASKHNFCFLVDEDRGEEALRLLHAEFIEE